MKKILALLLALTLVLALAGCGPQDSTTVPDADPTDTPAPSESAVPAVIDGLLPDNEIDLTEKFLGFPNSTVLLTANGVEVTAETYLYWLGNVTAYYDSMYAAYGMTMDLDEEIATGITWGEQFKQIALENSVLLASVPDMAKANGVELTAQDMAELEEEHVQKVTETGAEMYAYQLQVMNINDRTAFEMDKVSLLYTRLREALAQKLAAEVSDEEVAEYVEANDVLKAKHILLLTMDMTTREPYDDDTIALQKAKAEDILNQLKGGADFDTLMNQYSEDSGLAANPGGYTFTAGDMVSEFEEGTRALEYGEFSPELVESFYGYHIILRLDPDTPELRAEAAEERVNTELQAAVDGAEVVKAPEYDTFTTGDYYTNIIAYQESYPAPGSED